MSALPPKVRWRGRRGAPGRSLASSTRIDHTEALLREPLIEKAGLGSLNIEVRGHVKALDRAERFALIPYDVRRAREAQEQLENQEGLTRVHLAQASFASAYQAVQFDQLLRAGPAIAAILRGD